MARCVRMGHEEENKWVLWMACGWMRIFFCSHISHWMHCAAFLHLQQHFIIISLQFYSFSLARLSTCVCTHIAWIYRGLFAAVASSRKLCIFLKSCMHNATMIYSDSAQWNLHIIFVHVKNFRVKENLRTFGIKINFINESSALNLMNPIKFLI